MDGAATQDEVAGSGPGPGGDGAPSAPAKKRQRSFWRELPILVVIALALTVLIKVFAIQAFYIPSSSMENSLKIGDRVLVNKIVYHLRGIQRGDIVVFNGLDSWDPTVPQTTPSNPIRRFADWVGSAFGVTAGEKDYVKRVIGLPGDHVTCCDAQGRVTVNGVPLNEKAYLYPGNAPSLLRFDTTVPAGELWVMGDHRAVSYDSREHRGDPGGGSIPESKVIGRAFVVVWPLSRLGILSIPATFQQKALAAAGSAAPLVLGVAGALPVTLIQRRIRTRRGRSAGRTAQ
jgi:signal peptidase I